MSSDIDLRHVVIIDFETREIFFPAQPRTDGEASLGFRRANVFEHGFQGSQGHTSPIATNMTEQVMFNRIPF